MGLRLSCASRPAEAPDCSAKAAPCACSKAAAAATPAAAPAAAAADGAICLRLTLAADDHATVALEPAEGGRDIPDEDLCVRVQLQESFSPNQAIHLILLPIDAAVQGELSHAVGGWMGTPRKCAEELAAIEREQERPRSPTARLLAKMSPPRKARSPARQELAA